MKLNTSNSPFTEKKKKKKKNCQGKLIEPNVDEKIQAYASSLDKSQKNEDDSLGVMFAQKIIIQCE